MTDAINKYVVPIKAELNDIKHEAGIASMARGAELDSALTSFFIVLGTPRGLDGTYTVFGKVVEGMDVVRKIESVPTQGESPRERIEVQTMRVTRKN
jgi:peptidyl-prolyl cis-trans isomerase B (cyclophilin B)